MRPLIDRVVLWLPNPHLPSSSPGCPGRHASLRRGRCSAGVSQPSVSAAIGSLEACLGVELAERLSRRVVLTPAGHEVSAQARKVISDIDNLVSQAGERARPNAGPLRLGIIPTVAPYILAPVLRALARHMPDLRPRGDGGPNSASARRPVRGMVGHRCAGLTSGCSVGCRTAPLFGTVRAAGTARTSPGREGRPRPQHLARRPFAVARGGPLPGWSDPRNLSPGRRSYRPPSTRAASLTTIAQLVAAGLGATLLPATALPVETRKGKLAVPRFKPPAPGREIGLVFPPWPLVAPRAGEYRQLAHYLRRGLDRPGFARTGREKPT